MSSFGGGGLDSALTWAGERLGVGEGELGLLGHSKCTLAAILLDESMAP